MVLCITANSNTICVCIRRSSSEAVRHCFCKARLFRVFLTASCLHTWRNCESLSWVMRVCRSQGPRVTPSRQRQGRPALAWGNFQSGQAWKGTQLVLPFSRRANWPHSGCAGGCRLVKRRGLLAEPCNVFRSTDFWQRRSVRWGKMPAVNESQQCVCIWTTTWKALCNRDTVNKILNCFSTNNHCLFFLFKTINANKAQRRFCLLVLFRFIINLHLVLKFWKSF